MIITYIWLLIQLLFCNKTKVSSSYDYKKKKKKKKKKKLNTPTTQKPKPPPHPSNHPPFSFCREGVGVVFGCWWGGMGVSV
ncbi:hypothetical protein HanHA89_Chr10g0365971 [Helianthus annuus]|nr:hypothetical protein HanHA89_Chr10g0365971 [Helianthus annuus]